MRKTINNVLFAFLLIGILVSFASADVTPVSGSYNNYVAPVYNQNTNPQSYNGVGTYPSSTSLTNPTNSYGSYSNSYQYVQPNFNQYYTSDQISTYWPILSQMQNGQCNATSDFIIQIAPGGCSPAVVRSDLLEEQNVPVFCQLSAIKVNPLIKVSSITSISFQGNYSSDIAGISFHPARAAVNTYQTLLGSPLMSDIGYVVIVLKQNPVEKNMSKWVAGSLTATIQYDAEQAFGAGQSQFFIPVLSDNNWSSQYQSYGFWNGKGFVRVTDIQNNSATVDLYVNNNNLFREMKLNVGQTSDKIYFPGFYCLAGLQVKLNQITSPAVQAQLNIDGSQIWVREGSRILNNRCSVRQISALDDNTGSVSLSCPNGNINLLKQRQGAVFDMNSGTASTNLVTKNNGDLMASAVVGSTNVSEKADYYLVYAGQLPKNVVDLNGNSLAGQRVAILAGFGKQPTSDDLVSIATRITQVSSSSTIGGMFSSNNQIKLDEFARQIAISNPIIMFEGSQAVVNGIQITLQPLGSVADSVISSVDPRRKLLNNYFDKSNDAIQTLLTNYPLDKSVDGMTSFGEQGLLDEINLAKEIGRTDAVQSLARQFEKQYPNSNSFYYVDSLYSSTVNFNFGQAYTSALIDNSYHTIGLDSLQAVDKTLKNVNLRIGSNYAYGIREGDSIYLKDASKVVLSGSSTATGDYVTVTKIDVNSVTLDYVYRDTRNQNTQNGNVWQTEHLKAIGQGEYVQRGSPLITILVDGINVQQIADISILPSLDNTHSDANFSFKVGIEKRAIQLSPDQTKSMIDNLNKSIAQWDNINQKLGTVITVWKGACFATSGVLMLKNLVSGFSGESMARQQVMKSYRTQCAGLVGTGKQYSTDTECYNAMSSQIDSDVAKYTQAIQQTNTEITNAQNINTKSSGGLLDGSYVDSTGTLNKLKADHAGQTITIKVTDASGNLVDKQIAYSDMTSTEQIRAADTYNNLVATGASQTLTNTAQQNLNAQMMPLYNSLQTQKAASETTSTFKSLFKNSNITNAVVVGSENMKQTSYNGGKLGDLNSDSLARQQISGADNTPYATVSDKGQDFLVTLKPTAGNPNSLSVDKIYQENSSGSLVQVDFSAASKNTPGSQINPAIQAASEVKSQYVFIGSGPCKNPYKNAKIQFYDNSPNSKLPAIVPFDLDAGWYVKVPNTQGGLLSTGQQGYTAAGDVSFFWICNVGTNGMEENTGGDDNCQSFDVNTMGSVKSFSGCSLSSSEVQNLAQKGREAVRQAAQQYGKNPINIFGKSLQVAAPMTESVAECQDFMSPEDCKILFNVCDPVICPSSRCNLGGAYPNSNVVQTGIIGSIVLCLPNIKEGIIVPICLTGIHAGIDEFISILKSERDCLQTSLNTGQHVGICNEITSVYLCEFFWRQLAPVLNIIIPKMIEAAYGQGARGGGEYLTVMHSWDTLQNSISYFKDNYAQNSFAAFQMRSVEEAGGTFCRAFIGTSLPTDINSLLAPESPTQINAWFSEIPYTGATIPATSQYKVYYHIYAGKDQGVQYQVYLKDPPTSSYYNSNQIVVLDSGYIAQGGQVDQTKDFTAPAGYKNLCVDYNGQEKCGFSAVTTDFALNYLQMKYIADQANQTNINSEKTCISGSPSVLPLVNPNLEAGVTQAVQPSIDLNGVVRVCATNNPGNATDPSRWISVGNCGSQNLICWLDQNSVKNDVNQVNAINNNIANIGGNMQSLNGVGNGDNSFTPDQTRSLISGTDGARALINGLTDVSSGAFRSGQLAIIGDIVNYESAIVNYIESNIYPINAILDNVTAHGYSNADKAEALYLKASMYGIVTRALKQDFFATSATQSSSTEPVTSGNPGDTCDDGHPCKSGLICSNGVCETQESSSTQSTQSSSASTTTFDTSKVFTYSVPSSATIFKNSNIYFRFYDPGFLGFSSLGDGQGFTARWKYSTNQNSEWPASWVDVDSNLLRSIGFSGFASSINDFNGGAEILSSSTKPVTSDSSASSSKVIPVDCNFNVDVSGVTLPEGQAARRIYFDEVPTKISIKSDGCSDEMIKKITLYEVTPSGSQSLLFTFQNKKIDNYLVEVGLSGYYTLTRGKAYNLYITSETGKINQYSFEINSPEPPASNEVSYVLKDNSFTLSLQDSDVSNGYVSLIFGMSSSGYYYPSIDSSSSLCQVKTFSFSKNTINKNVDETTLTVKFDGQCNSGDHISGKLVQFNAGDTLPDFIVNKNSQAIHVFD